MNQHTIWFPTYAQALTYTKGQASLGKNALLGTEATTPLLWLTDKWGLWGSGEVLVSTAQRLLLVQHLIKDYPALTASVNTCILIARFFGQVVGVPAFKKAQENPPATLSEAEVAVLDLAHKYEVELAKRNLIEQGTALFALPSFVFTEGISFSTFCNLPICFQQALAAHGISLDMPTNSITKLENHIEPKFIFSAGKSVQSRLLFEEIIETLECDKQTAADKDDASITPAAASLDKAPAETKNQSAAGNQPLVGKILLVHPKPLEFYRNAFSTLSEKNISVATIAPKYFYETSFGKGFLALVAYALSDYAETSKLVDFLLSSISGISKKRAFELDALWRADRLTTKEQQIALVLQESPTFEYLLELLSDADASIVLGFIEDYLTNTYSKNPAFLAEQISALEALRGLYNAARLFELAPLEFIPILESITITSPFTTSEEVPDVVITTLNKATAYAPNSFDTVLVCSLDSETYKASEKHDAPTTLLNKLGITSCVSRLATMRHQFGSTQKCAQKKFVCERVLSEQGTELYPAFLLDEFVSLYRADENDKHSQDLPASLCGNAISKGEEDLSLNMTLSATESLDASYGNDIAKMANLKDALVFTRIVDGKKLPILSPSAIESYINCPYRWFIDRKIKPEELDENFSALEKGTFTHKALEVFYKTLEQKTGNTKVEDNSFDSAIAVLDEVFDQVKDDQPLLDPLSGRLVAIDSVEESEIDSLKNFLETCLRNQTTMPKEFSPAFHEYTFRGFESFNDAVTNGSAADQAQTSTKPIIYAGAVINGRVDRVDLSADGKYYAVIDYKGSIFGHRAGLSEKDFDTDTFVAPHKVQALIYASALQSVFPDRKPVAALYLSYNAKPGSEFLAGSFSSSLYDASAIAHKDSVVEINFQSYLEMVESYIEQRIAELVAGNVEPNPLCEASCKYCPVTKCEKRWSYAN